MRRRSGTGVVVASLLGFALLSAGMRWGLLRLSSERFIVSIEAVPPAGRRLPRDRPLRVRLSGRQAAGPAPALALLLFGDGALVAGPQPMTAGRDDRGRTEWTAVLPPLGPGGAGTVAVAAVAVRLRSADRLPDQIDQIRRAAWRAPGDTHQEVFGRVLMASRALGGHAEMIAAEVREQQAPPTP